MFVDGLTYISRHPNPEYPKWIYCAPKTLTYLTAQPTLPIHPQYPNLVIMCLKNINWFEKH